MRVSVCLPVKNGETTLARALDSVLAQTFRDFEVLVFDDGSTDRTAEVASIYDVRLIRSDNVGVAEARNRMLREARGELIAFIDADDEWLPEKLERQVHLLDSGDAVLVHTDGWYLHEDGRVESRDLSLPKEAIAFDHVLPDNKVITSSVLVRQEALVDAGGFAPLKRCSDWSGWLSLARVGGFVHLPEKLVRYYVLGQSLANAGYLFHEDQYRLLSERVLPERLELFKDLDPSQRARYTRMIVRSMGVALSSMAKLKERAGDRESARRLHKQALRTAPDVARVWIRALRGLI